MSVKPCRGLKYHFYGNRVYSPPPEGTRQEDDQRWSGSKYSIRPVGLDGVPHFVGVTGV